MTRARADDRRIARGAPLVGLARSTSGNPLAVVSVFVNPTQFTSVKDLALAGHCSLEPLHALSRGARLLVFAQIGGVRLIDAAAIEPTQPGSNRSSDEEDR